MISNICGPNNEIISFVLIGRCKHIPRALRVKLHILESSTAEHGSKPMQTPERNFETNSLRQSTLSYRSSRGLKEILTASNFNQSATHGWIE
jgi:hypothetical protein